MMFSRYNLFTSYFFKRHSQVFPTTLFVEPTNHCNLSCFMCPHGKMRRDKGLMDIELFREIMGQAASGGTRALILHFMGESLIHPRLPEFISLARRRGFYVQLSTNGTLLTRDKVGEILAAGPNLISIDFDGDSPEAYEAARSGARFGTVLGNIKTALRERDARAPGCAIALQIIMFPGQRGDLLNRLTPEETRAVEVRRKFFNDTFAAGAPVIHKRPCFHLWNDMTIAWNGDVPLCCVDYDCARPLGRIGDSSIGAIWNGEVINGLRAKHRSLDYDDLPLCGSCSLPNQPHFNPLYVAASILTGPVLTRRLMSPALNLLQRLQSFSRPA